MKMTEREKVAGTEVTIGRRVVRRRGEGGKSRTLTYRTYTAVFKDVDGRWASESLSITNKNLARRKALEIQTRLEAGRPRHRVERIPMSDLLEEYRRRCEGKGLAPKSLAKYASELRKIGAFCEAEGILHADRFDERAFYRYRAWLLAQTHKQGGKYAEKSISASLVLCKQVFKWGWRQKLLPTYELASVSVPSAKARPQPCPTTEEVERIMAHLDGRYADAVAILAYSGLRVGELVQLRWEDVLLDRGELGMLHVRRGGSGGTTKDKEERFVPIHPRIRAIFERLPKKEERVLPRLRDRALLAQVKRGAKAAGMSGSLKTHSLRHHFASMVSNAGVPHRMALAWLGHSDSSILELYYHLHDEESERAMAGLA